ncbi:MAG: AI-2E family transporter [Pseudomonadota bacterium]
MTRQNIERVSFFLLLAIVSIAFLSLLSGFLVALFWSVAFAILFAPLVERLERVLGDRPGLVSVLTVTIVLLAVVLPLIGIGFAVAAETARLTAEVQQGRIGFGTALDWARENLPVVIAFAENYGFEPDRLRETLSSAAMASGQWVASNAVRAGQGTLNFTLSLFLMIYLLYFFLRDGPQIVDRLVQVLPLGDARERALFARFAQVVRATTKGTFVIGAVQGAIGGITFAALGIEGAVLWGVLMALLSLLPAVGAALVWLPAAIILFAGGDYWGGGIIVFVGMFVIGLADNLLRPILVGRDTRMPDYLILLATLGGLGSFGISGLVIGPLIAALFITVWEMFETSVLLGDPGAAEADAFNEADAVAGLSASGMTARAMAMAGSSLPAGTARDHSTDIDDYVATRAPDDDDFLDDGGLDTEFGEPGSGDSPA